MQALYSAEAANFLFQQDNAAMHTSSETKNWFAQHPEVCVLQWPPRSPDLSPIENMWAQLLQNWPNRTFSNRQMLLNEVSTRWDALRGTEYITNLYNSMPRRLQQVLDRNGNWCSF